MKRLSYLLRTIRFDSGLECKGESAPLRENKRRPKPSQRRQRANEEMKFGGPTGAQQNKLGVAQMVALKVHLNYSAGLPLFPRGIPRRRIERVYHLSTRRIKRSDFYHRSKVDQSVDRLRCQCKIFTLAWLSTRKSVFH